MPSPSIKPRFCPSGPVMVTASGSNKYINTVEFPPYNFVIGPATTLITSVYVSGIDQTYNVLVNITNPDNVYNDWFDGGPFSIASFWIGPDSVEVQGVTYQEVFVAILCSEALLVDNPISLTADLMFFKEGELVTQAIIPP